MTWPETPPERALRGGCLRVAWLVILVAFAGFAPGTFAARDADTPQVWLLTYGPGEIYWQRFGHNAIWIRDPSLGLDHTFNFGFFDFEQRGFLRNFILGRLNYFAAARPAEVELAEYIDADRSIRAQRLDLEPEQALVLTEHLLDEISPGHREYLYDYYRHNCSTRIRDAIDLALGGALRERLTAVPATLNYRDHTRRLTGMDSWLYLGLEAGLGSPVDRANDQWQETFIPGVLSDAVEGVHNPATGRPLVAEEVMLHESSLQPPPATPRALWPRYLAVSVVLLLLAGLAVRFSSRLTWRGLSLGWLSVAGVIGAVPALLWCCTDHWAATLNFNLLLLNPLWLLVALIPVLRRPGAWLVLLCAILALAPPWLPPAQYNIDVAALLLPLNAVAAFGLLRKPSGPNLGQ